MKPLNDFVAEKEYWVKRWFSRHGQSVLFKLIPRWLEFQVLLKAARHIKDNEVVPEVLFTEILKRAGEK